MFSPASERGGIHCVAVVVAGAVVAGAAAAAAVVVAAGAAVVVAGAAPAVVEPRMAAQSRPVRYSHDPLHVVLFGFR